MLYNPVVQYHILIFNLSILYILFSDFLVFLMYSIQFLSSDIYKLKVSHLFILNYTYFFSFQIS